MTSLKYICNTVMHKLKVIIKFILPNLVVNIIHRLKKLLYYTRHDIMHKYILFKKQNKTPITVLFITVDASSWKVDRIYHAMSNDKHFNPIILVCPSNNGNDDYDIDAFRSTFSFFCNKKYNVIPALSENHTWINVKEDINPDLIFFTNPHPLTRPEYYTDCFEKFLSCYVPYAHDVSFYSNGEAQYNRQFHNLMWRIYAPHEESRRLYNKFSEKRGKNVIVSGYPACEAFYTAKHDAFCKRVDENVWKTQNKNMKRIIYAPHHTIDMPELPYATFLFYADEILDFSKIYRQDLQWAFKPHPLLKKKLYLNKNWGVKRTDNYYNYWNDQTYTQMELDAYEKLFIGSDAIIHDSGSFLAEYLYLRRPALYLVNKDNTGSYFNNFGKKAFSACQHAYCIEDVEKFLSEQIEGTHGSISDIENFYTEELEPYFVGEMPSTRIISDLKSAFGLT